MTTTLLTLDQTDAWRAALARAGVNDVYYRTGYLRPLRDRGEGDPHLFVYDDGNTAAVHVTLLRPLSALPFAHPHGDRFDAISPYGYSGPLCSDPKHATKIWAAWNKIAREQNIVAEFVRFHPLLANHAAWVDAFEVRRAGRTVWMDLAGDVENNLGKSRRRDANYARRQGVVIERVGVDYLPAFGAMYRATMAQREADDYYFFDDDYFATLSDGLSDDFWLMRAHVDDVDCSYALCLRGGDLLHYHLSCSAEAMAETRSVNLLLSETAQRGQQAGCKRFHLGGGYRGEDSLFAFKARFSPHRADFHIGRAVHDEAIVDELTAVARENDVTGDGDFFPPYRSRR